jgi:3-methyladenine DNA glycosylase AlkD
MARPKLAKVKEGGGPTAGEVVESLRAMANPRNVEGMARYGINPKGTLGISVWKLREIAGEIWRDHGLALELWKTGIHEARLLAAFIDDATKVTESQMDSWAEDFDSWDVCDQVTTALFDWTPHAYKKVLEWSERDEEFVRRAAFSLIAGLAVHDKNAPDERIERLLLLIRKAATDERNYVRKAVNWALRNIGKRNPSLNKRAIACAEEIQKLDSKAARWIASDALRELKGEKVRAMLGKKAQRPKRRSSARRT